MAARASSDELSPAPATRGERVSVIIKALNEERHIDAAIVSALAAVATVGGEVILADSASTDRTVDIARHYPITILQLKNAAERRCGIGPQLGYQLARGEFVYILDGDMEIDPAFLKAALVAMDADPKLGGVGGLVEEESDANYEFRGRKRRGAEAIARHCEWLDMGGLYRAAALREVGYFSNRNLHSFEELDLGLRLGVRGWTLRRLAVRGVLHHGRTDSNWTLLMHRWRSRYLDGAGELLRAALGHSYFFRAASAQRHLILSLLIWLGLVGGLLMLPLSHSLLLVTVIGIVALILIRAWRSRSIADACFGQIVWQVNALAMVRGFCAKTRNPQEPIEYNVISLPPTSSLGYDRS
jgi:glycosyltransferase involved in cell wall biosynthesis